MIGLKNKKFKGFSLIEAMVLFTALSLILLAFLPVMLQRNKKVYDSDCVGGQKSVRVEYNANDNVSSFTVPKRIASPITFTLIGAGGGGEQGEYNKSGGTVVEYTSDSCSISAPSAGRTFYTNARFFGVENGVSASCNYLESGAGGSSGRYYSNVPLLVKKSAGATSSGCSFLSNCSGISAFSAVSGDEGSLGTPQKLFGGAPGINLTSSNMPAGVGESCLWTSVEINGENVMRYVGQGDAGSSACKITYRKATSGAGGASGAYLKFPLIINAGNICQFTIGAGTNRGDTKTDTVLTCGNTSYTAGSAQDNTAGTISLPDNFSTIEEAEGQAGGYDDNSSIEGTRGADVAIKNGNTVIYTISKGGQGGCFGIYNSFYCINPHGKQGSLGSGGGGGSCNEAGCGMGGKGGDGLIIMEYKEYCK